MSHLKEYEVNLDMGGDEPSASSGFFWPADGFFKGVFVVAPDCGGIAEVTCCK